MKNISIGQIGVFIDDFAIINYFSSQSIFDFDVIILDLDFISHILSTGNQSSLMEPHPTDLRNKQFIEKRRNDFYEFIDEGRILIILLPQPRTFMYTSGRYGHGEFLLTDLLPLNVILDSNKGSAFMFLSGSRFFSIFKKYESILEYHSNFTSGEVPGVSLATIKGSNKAVASIDKNVLYLPSFKPLPVNDDKPKEYLKEIIDEICGTDDEALPEWTHEYLIPNESNEEAHLQELEQEMVNLEKLISVSKKKLDATRMFKQLFCGTGSTLESVVLQIFQALGCTILESENSKTDLTISFKHQIAVVEIKGVNKSAAQEHAMQLEKWITEYGLKHNIQPKGILIVNTFRQVPLAERTFKSFPDQMQPYSAARQHCLITGVQLLGLYLESINEPTSADRLIQSLFDSHGIYPDFLEWNKFIRKIS